MTVDDVYARIHKMIPDTVNIRDPIGAVNWVERTIAERGDWSFFFKTGSFRFVEEYATGTVAITNGSTEVVGTGTAWNASHVSRKIRIAGGQEYVVYLVTDGTHLTLDRAIEESTASGQTYTIYENEYSLASDVRQLIRMWDTNSQVELECIAPADAKRRQALSLTLGDPARYALFGVDSNGNPKVYIHPYPTEVHNVDYYYWRNYTPVTAATSVLDFPASLNETIVQGAFARILRLAGIEAWEQEAALFREMLEREWRYDQPEQDFLMKFKRADEIYEPDLTGFQLARRVTET